MDQLARQAARDLLVEILDVAFPNSIPMHKKWDLVVAVKHFHQRRGIER
ncbi:MAG: hypothetical protein IV100_14755 [Myxococcales bacterium]|nr:hypothetical protein [Myxococcales bacterium]